MKLLLFSLSSLVFSFSAVLADPVTTAESLVKAFRDGAQGETIESQSLNRFFAVLRFH